MEKPPSEVQTIGDGFGAPYHRVFAVEIPVTMETALTTMGRLQGAINEFSPQLLATFEKTKGDATQLKVGDCFQIRITGPWNGPVVVSDVCKTGFKFKTLEGHLEAGEIEFRLVEKASESVRFEIESLAKSRDRIVDFLYDKVPIAKMAQTEMWSAFCKNFAFCALQLHYPNEPDLQIDPDKVQILSEKKNQDTGLWEPV